MIPSEDAWQKIEKDVASWVHSVAGKRFLVGYDMYSNHCVNYILIHTGDGWERHVVVSDSVLRDVDVNMYELIDSYVFNWCWSGITD